LIVNVITESQRDGGATGAAAYRPSLLVMVGLLVIGFIANLLVRPVAEKYHEHTDEGAPYPDSDDRRVASVGTDTKGSR
jgi:hypothetical protein